eukprot:6478963-Amphidinium_carterae.4
MDRKREAMHWSWHVQRGNVVQQHVFAPPHGGLSTVLILLQSRTSSCPSTGSGSGDRFDLTFKPGTHVRNYIQPISRKCTA